MPVRLARATMIARTAMAAVVSIALTACVPAPFREPYPVGAVELPRDDAGHAAPVEWWYYTGHFADEQGVEYAFMLTFFKAYTPPGVDIFGGIPAYAIADKGHVAHLARGGSVITPAGETIGLADGDSAFEPTGATWTSSATGAVYPVAWRLAIPRFGIDTVVTATVLDQEMDTRATTGIVYWEGAVTARGSDDGVGFVELTNYDLYPFGRTDRDTPLQPLRGPFGR